jgi:hypothetical protein
MVFHFVAQKLLGDPSPSMNLFVVAVSILVISSRSEFREKLQFMTIVVSSILIATLSVLILLVLPFVSEIVGYQVKAKMPSPVEIGIIYLFNFAVAIILLRLGNKHWGLAPYNNRKPVD